MLAFDEDVPQQLHGHSAVYLLDLLWETVGESVSYDY